MSSYIKIPTYKDASIHTLIKDIPAIINSNNAENSRLFNSIFNFSNKDVNLNLNNNKYDASQYLIVPLITDGIVKGGAGEFMNLRFDLLDKSTASKSFIGENPAVIDHKYAINRFSNEIKEFTHDAASIYYNNDLNTNLSVYDKLSNMDKIVETINTDYNQLKNKINSMDADIQNICERLNINKSYNDSPVTFNMSRSINQNVKQTQSNESGINSTLVDTYNSSTNSYTYPAKIYANYVDGYKVKNDPDTIDIKNNKKFRYYIVDSNYTKVNNQYMCALNAKNIGVETSLIIDNTYNNDLIIRLDYDGINYNCIEINKADIDLCRLTLTCVDINEYGSKWYLNNYSGNIKFVKI